MRKPSVTTDRLDATQLIEFDACTGCGECLKWCPVYDVIKSGAFSPNGNGSGLVKGYTPRDKVQEWKQFMDAGYGLRAKLFSPQKIPESIIHDFSERLYHCAACGVCGSVCPAGINTAGLWDSLRSNLVNRGNGPLQSQEFFTEVISKYGNPYRADQRNRLQWLPDDIEVSESAEIAYFVGCTVEYKAPLHAVSVVRILEKFDIPFTTLGEDELCCCADLISIGHRDTENIARDFARRNIEALQARGVEKVLFSCPGCYQVAVDEWPRYYGGKLPFECVHASQFVFELLDKEQRWTNHIDKTVTYHDPCHLGRQMGVYEPPRDAIKRLPGVNFVEMERNREFQRCCGAGGNALREGVSDLTKTIAKVRLQDALDVGAELLVTSCPCCFLTLEGGNGKGSNNGNGTGSSNGNGNDSSGGNGNGDGAGVVVKDLATLCARSLGLI